MQRALRLSRETLHGNRVSDSRVSGGEGGGWRNRAWGGKRREKWEKRATRARAAAETTDGATATHCHCKMNKGQECRCTRHLQRFGRKVGSQAQMNSGYTRVA